MYVLTTTPSLCVLTPPFLLLMHYDVTSSGGHRPWFVQPSCATTGDGLVEGLDWLSHKLRTYTKPATAVGSSS